MRRNLLAGSRHDSLGMSNRVALPRITVAPALPDGIGVFLASRIESRLFPGAAWAVGTEGESRVGTVGRLTYRADAPPVDRKTLFDLASLTKVLFTTTLAMHAVAERRFGLDEPLCEISPSFACLPPSVTPRRLLRHDAGYEATLPFYRLSRTPSEARRSIRESRPTVEGTVYSCVNFLLLGELLAVAFGVRRLRDLAGVFANRVTRPLGLRDMRFGPLPERDRRRCAPTEGDLCGVVHDENARFLGGVSGNAGLFASIEAVARFAQAVLRDDPRIFPAGFLAEWSRPQSSQTERALGWNTNAFGAAGPDLSPEAFGHTGFTGTSLWIDPCRRRFFVLLTNRIHPRRNNEGMAECRLGFHRVALGGAVGCAPESGPP